MKFWTVLFTVVALLQSPLQAMAQGRNNYPNSNGSQGSSGREFVMSCTYGVLAGTLVGTASLAFTNKPSESLNRVARGASLGLYAGILLGLYVVYVVPSMNVEEEIEDPMVKIERLPFLLAPRFESGRLAGADFSMNILNF